jgi:hypothetical protein
VLLQRGNSEDTFRDSRAVEERDPAELLIVDKAVRVLPQQHFHISNPILLHFFEYRRQLIAAAAYAALVKILAARGSRSCSTQA